MEQKKTVKRYSLTKQVADELERMVETGVYAVGERIPTEAALMEQFQVSRNTLREAIKTLTASGVLEVKQGDGTYVRSNNRFNANMNQEYARVSIENIMEARAAIEMNIVYLAAKRRDEKDLATMREALLRRQDQLGVTKENTQADVDFHMSVALACHNQILIDLYRSMLSYLESQIAKRQAETVLKSAQIDALHEKLFRAISEAEPEEARIYSKEILRI